MKKPKVLLYDIETTPQLGWAWQTYDTNLLKIEKESYVLSIAYKWLGQKKIHVLHCEGATSDKKLIKQFSQVLEDANMVIGHNVDRFDTRKVQGRMLKHKLAPHSGFSSVDTLKIVRKYFSLPSNRLDDVCEFLGLGNKLSNPGISMWLGCINGDAEMWRVMRKYNKHDVVLLEALYNYCLPWMESHPNLSVMIGKPENCPKCCGNRIHSIGHRYTKSRVFKRFRCYDCNGIFESGGKSPKKLSKKAG